MLNFSKGHIFAEQTFFQFTSGNHSNHNQTKAKELYINGCLDRWFVVEKLWSFVEKGYGYGHNVAGVVVLFFSLPFMCFLTSYFFFWKTYGWNTYIRIGFWLVNPNYPSTEFTKINDVAKNNKNEKKTWKPHTWNAMWNKNLSL